MTLLFTAAPSMANWPSLYVDIGSQIVQQTGGVKYYAIAGIHNLSQEVTVESPDGNLTSDGFGTPIHFYDSLSELKTGLTSGPWTATFDPGQPNQTTYQFNVDGSAVTSSDFPKVYLENPAGGSQNVAPDTIFTFAAPAAWSDIGIQLSGGSSPTSINVDLLRPDGLQFQPRNLLSNGDYSFLETYYGNLPDLSISFPELISGPIVFGGWQFGSEVASMNEDTFTVSVPEPGNVICVIFTFVLLGFCRRNQTVFC